MSEFERKGNLVENELSRRGEPTVRVWWFWCPGCEDVHRFEEGKWTFNGDYDKPTFHPSLLLNGNPALHNPAVPRCHLFLTEGILTFLSDCTHKLVGQRVPLPEPAEWWLL